MYSWLEIEPLKGLLQENPLLGYCYPVNLEKLKKNISKRLSLNVLSIDHAWHYSTLSEARAKLPSDGQKFTYSLSGFEGTVEIYFSQVQLETIIQNIAGDCPLGEDSRKALLDFFVSSLILSFISEPTFKSIQPTLVAKGKEIKSKKALKGIVTIECAQANIQMHILVEDSIYQQWLENWSKTPYLGVEAEKAKNIHLPLNIKLSEIELSADELVKLQVGDWISLKSVGIGEAIEGCHLELTLSGSKVGEAKLKNGEAHVLARDEFFDRLKAN